MLTWKWCTSVLITKKSGSKIRVSVRLGNFPNQKPWVLSSEHGPLPLILGTWRHWGIPDMTYGKPSEMPKEPTGTGWSLNYRSSDPRRMWCGLRSITDYKGRNSRDAQPTASLPDEFNTLYTRFEATNTIPTVRLAVDQDDCCLSLTTAGVRRAFKRWHSRLPPQSASRGIHLYIQPLPESV